MDTALEEASARMAAGFKDHDRSEQVEDPKAVQGPRQGHHAGSGGSNGQAEAGKQRDAARIGPGDARQTTQVEEGPDGGQSCDVHAGKQTASQHIRGGQDRVAADNLCAGYQAVSAKTAHQTEHTVTEDAGIDDAEQIHLSADRGQFGIFHFHQGGVSAQGAGHQGSKGNDFVHHFQTPMEWLMMPCGSFVLNLS